MIEMITVREAAEHWNITERRVSTLCKNGKITGAKKQGNRWMIPADTQKPADQRIKTGDYRKKERRSRLPLPIGVSNYCRASSEYYYIDKTMMIKDFIDERPMVTLFTRPRRFGKTLNMDMLRTFFEKGDKDTSVFFRNKKIPGRRPLLRSGIFLRKRLSATGNCRPVKNVTDTAEIFMRSWQEEKSVRWSWHRHCLICQRCSISITV